MIHDEHTPLLEPPPAQTALEQVEAWVSEAWESRLTSRTRCRELSQQALSLARQEGFLRGEGFALRNLGFCDYQASNFAEALAELSEGLQIAEKLGEPVLERDCLNYIGAI